VKYRYLDNHRLHRILIRLAKILIVIVFFLLIAGIYVLVDSYIQRADKTEVTSRQNSSVQASRENVQTTEFFQFQAPPDWVEVSNETKPPLYVYREINNKLIKRELRIYVNSPPEDIRSSRVLPVDVKDDQIIPSEISEHCKANSAFSPSQRSPRMVTWQGVQILCEPDSIEFNVVVGTKGNSRGVLMKRPNGDPISYAMIYRDLTANPSSLGLYSILRSFQAR
jgi:hypothetical protein